jgi:hypothetical protein
MPIEIGWDKDFTFKSKSRPDFNQESETASMQAVGAVFLSGWSRAVAVCMSNGEERYFSVSLCLVREINIPVISAGLNVVLFGKDTEIPSMVSGFCRRNKFCDAFVCPLTDGLGSFGKLVTGLMFDHKDMPRRDLLYRPNRKAFPGVGVELDEKLGSDAYGKMAYHLRSGGVAMNQVMSTPCRSFFHNRVLTVGKKWFGNPVFVMKNDAARRFFPHEPISLREFAAITVPVEFSNTAEFSAVSGFAKPKVEVQVTTSSVPGCSVLLDMVRIIGGFQFVCSSDIKDVSTETTMPVFRFGQVYNMRAKDILGELDEA